MDKNAIKKFAVWARKELMERVTKKAMLYGITEAEVYNPEADSVNGLVLTAVQKKERKALIEQIFAKGYAQVMEETAYTWFNRFCALRFMEVNNYLPSLIRVFTNDKNEFRPQILTEALDLDWEGLDKAKIYALKEANADEELYKYLLITQCNALNKELPRMFQKLEDFTELLFPDNLLREGSVIEQMIKLIPEEDWQDAVQIIGWLYQYYNIEPKKEVFANLDKGIKISKHDIPAATQLFTPDWIVRYMVENSLGRLWLEGHANEELQAGWKYYLQEAAQEQEVAEKLAAMREQSASLDVSALRCIDPCMGSGHILAYMFDMLMEIYRSEGYRDRDAVKSIIMHNLYGLDIDERAAQLAYFVVMMQGCKYDRRFLSRGYQPHVYAISEANGIDRELLAYFGVSLDEMNRESALNQLNGLLDAMQDACEYGSIITVPEYDFALLRDFVAAFDAEQNLFASGELEPLQEKLQQLIDVGEALAQKYEVVVTNPPYRGVSDVAPKLSSYLKSNFPDSKSDLFAVFMEVCHRMTASHGYQAMITRQTWMSISSFKKLRAKIQTLTIMNMIHLGARAFEDISGEVVQTTSFVLANCHIAGYKGTYCRLIEPTTQAGKEEMFLAKENRYAVCSDKFSKIVGAPIAYWIKENLLQMFDNIKVGEAAVTRLGMATADNDRFLRLFWEIRFDDCKIDASSSKDCVDSMKKWFPYAKGGTYRKWYGNNEYLVNWFDNGIEIRSFSDEDGKIRSHNYNLDFIFKKGITWNALSSAPTSFRYLNNSLFDNAGSSLFLNNADDYEMMLAFLNSKLPIILLPMINSTYNYQPGTIALLPFVKAEKTKSLVHQNITLSKSDWDSFETSWDFTRHPLMRGAASVSAAYAAWKQECAERFNTLKANEEELNRIFIDIYGLADELTPEVEEKDVTVRRFFDSKEEIPESMKGSSYALTKQDAVKSLISYAVGCMFGRYSLDKPGLIYAGGIWDENNYRVFPADKDAIIPICDEEYFDDDIVGRFLEFIKIAYGEETFEANLQFIAEALGGNGSAREVIRAYFLNGFYKDHCKTYQKRPIYWLFDSGKKNGFKCLVYLHRYAKDTVARIRTDYLHEQQSRYRTSISDLQNRINNAPSTGVRVKLQKQLSKFESQSEEARLYEEKIHHLADKMVEIDLDDGVKHNYEIFKDVLAKVK